LDKQKGVLMESDIVASTSNIYYLMHDGTPNVKENKVPLVRS
jgi:hypothetical protein